MLSPLTLDYFARHTCPRCEQPLGCYHAYPLMNPSQVISMTSDLAPMHLHCAEEHAEDIIGDLPVPTPPAVPPLRVIAVVKSAPKADSARLIRLHPEDPETSTLRLFAPKNVHFHHITWVSASGKPPPTIANGSVSDPSATANAASGSIIIRPATNDEVFHYMEPALKAAMITAQDGTDERRELLRTVGLIQKRWITPARIEPS